VEICEGVGNVAQTVALFASSSTVILSEAIASRLRSNRGVEGPLLLAARQKLVKEFSGDC
jgi:hypothetical protein